MHYSNQLSTLFKLEANLKLIEGGISSSSFSPLGKTTWEFLGSWSFYSDGITLIVLWFVTRYSSNITGLIIVSANILPIFWHQQDQITWPNQGNTPNSRATNELAKNVCWSARTGNGMATATEDSKRGGQKSSRSPSGKTCIPLDGGWGSQSSSIFAGKDFIIHADLWPWSPFLFLHFLPRSPEAIQGNHHHILVDM